MGQGETSAKELDIWHRHVAGHAHWKIDSKTLEISRKHVTNLLLELRVRLV